METDNYSKDCELVLGLVAPVGVNLEDVRERLSVHLNQFKYHMNFVHLSEVAAEYAADFKGLEDECERLDGRMNIGNRLREKSGRGDFLSLLAINEINKKRETELKPLHRNAHLIRSLKHPDEVETLRQVYGPGFFLLGVSSSVESRERYLRDVKGVPELELKRLIKRDDKEKEDFGQSTRDVFQMADAFVTSDSQDFTDQLGRTLNLLFSKPVVPPTEDEYAMFMAYAASLRSADLSRQVGAVLANEDFDIVATGANDVPKFGGGLYWPTPEDQRDYIIGHDTNELRKNEIILKIMNKINGASEKTEGELLKEGRLLLKETGLLDITEYGRAVHAEMEALLSSARNGISTRRATLYTTTYPCHNCAKHIVAAGVKKVKYIEPYPKSYATEFYSDSIDASSSLSLDDTPKVIFEPFVGIGPRRFVDLFSMDLSSGRKLKRKESGKIKEWDREKADLRVPMNPLSYMEAETILVSELAELSSGGKLNE